ncbi:MAG TPA: hypothetical protein VK689_20970 [Armatimonadota bacterium]|nr:hypothetical protein [Armatimonadota bacterium]
MPLPERVTRVLETDLLYRKLRRGQWSGSEVYETAFIDHHNPRLSVYVARIATPRAVLEFFCRLAYARRLTRDRAPQPEDLLEYGEGIAVFPAALVIHQLRLSFVGNEGEPDQIREDGHINILHGQSYAIDLAEAARPLTREEILER